MRMISPVAPVLAVNRIMAGLGCLMMLLLLILQVDSSAIHREKREVPRYHCPKLEFWSESHKTCYPCHLCGPEVSDLAIRQECKDKNPQPIAHHGGQGAWCDDPNSPLPECPPLPETTSPRCTKNDRKYAPGCECTIGCGGQKSLALHCTQNLTWSGATVKEIEECQLTLTTTSLPPTTETTTAVGGKNENLVFVLSLAIALTVAATIAMVIVVVCVCNKKRQREMTCSNQSSPSSSENSSEIGADYPLIGKTSGASVKLESPVSQSSSEVDTGASAQPSTETSQQEVREVPFPAPGDNSKEESAFQTRQAEPKAVLCMGLSEKRQEAEVLIQGVSCNSEEQTGNDQRHALEDFLKYFHELKQFTRMFDQEYSLGQLSWHKVARRLVNWNVDDVKSSEYLLLPNTNSSPGDGPMYKVLKEAFNEGKGLLDLLRCLQSFHDRNFTAEKQLEDFWVKWKAKHARQEEIC